MRILWNINSFLVYFFTAILLSGCGGGGGDGGSVTPTASLSTLDITSVEDSLKVSETIQLVVTGKYSDGSTQNLASSITWSVADTTIFEVSSTGVVTALSAGTTTVTATSGGVSTTQDISVKALVDLSISPASVTWAIAYSQQLNVTGRYTDNSVENLNELVSWVSSDASIASTSDSGRVLGISAGTTSVTASVETFSSTLSITVSAATLQSIVVTSPVAQLFNGLTSNFSANGIYTDGIDRELSDQVVWSVSDPAIASIDSETGALTALQTGTLSVLASKEGLTGSLVISVSSATLTGIAITPTDVSLAEGTNLQVSVSATFSDNTNLDVSEQVEWSTSDSLIAAIKNNSSTVQGFLAGSAVLSAQLLGQQASLSVTVTDTELVSISVSPVNASIPLGYSQQYYAQGEFTDGTFQDITSSVSWLSSNQTQALISNTESLGGVADAISIGSTTITAVLGDIQQDTLLTVSNATLSNIEIQPANQDMATGTDHEIKALGHFTDGSVVDLTSKVAWSSSNSSVASMLLATNGSVLGLDDGTALISAVFDEVVGIGSITVSDITLQSLSITLAQATMPNGMSQNLKATGTYSDMSTKDLTQQVSWQSDDILKATVSNDKSGWLTAISPGQLSISASLGDVIEQISIEVTSAVLTNIQIDSSTSQLNVASSELLSAIASFSDSSTLDVSSQVNWSSSDTNIASVGNSELDKGVVTAQSTGSTDIFASLQGVNSSPFALKVTSNPNVLKALNLSVQPNLILNDNNDTAQVNLVLVPSTASGLIADGTPVTLTITEGDIDRNVSLVTENGEVSYSLQSSYDGFISLSATAGGYSANSGVSSTGSVRDSILITGQTDGVYESNILRTGSTFSVFLRNLSNRKFLIEQINIGYLAPNNGDIFVNVPESPLTSAEFISDGDLTAGESHSILYELDNDIEASTYVISYLITDVQSDFSFQLDGIFNFSQ